MEKRLSYIDVVAGIMISWMILGHCGFFSDYQVSFYKFLGFYMPWFFYKSGMFFSNKEPKQLLKKDALKLLRTFVVYSFIGWIVWSILGLIDGSLGLKSCIVMPVRNFIRQGNINANGPLWFLLSLFIVRQLSNVLIIKKLLPPPCFVNPILCSCRRTLCHRLV